jgi:hypothetical protein
MSAGRVVALVLGLLLLLVAALMMAGGGGLLWADRAERTDGYLLSNEETLSGPGYALVSERIDLSTGADWVPLSAALGSVRFEATGTDPGSETFVGIAPISDAAAYLGGVERTVIDDLGIDSPTPRDLSGGEPSGPPADQDFWTAQASGAGTQSLTWVPAEGNWMLVVMNADGSAGISVESRIGATFPALSGLGWGLLITGLVCLVVGALLLVLAAHRPADRRGPAYPVSWPSSVGPSPAGPSPAWPTQIPPQQTAPQQAGPQPAGPASPVPPWSPPAQADRTTATDSQPSPTRTPEQ